jgi:ubiquinone/menaquinone biosynthesis C-methylase UbiE
MTTKASRHWDGVYGSRVFDEVSWYQTVPERSLRYIQDAAPNRNAAIIDVGGGASTLVDHLLDAGFSDVTVLDIAENALQQARHRLGTRGDAVNWVVADVRTFMPDRDFMVWHDRAVLHFLVDAGDRARYLEALRRSLLPGAKLVLSTFGPDGPLKCSGLQIRRYDIDRLMELLGPYFELQGHEFEDHETPAGAKQQFLYTSWTRTD